MKEATVVRIWVFLNSAKAFSASTLPANSLRHSASKALSSAVLCLRQCRSTRFMARWYASGEYTTTQRCPYPGVGRVQVLIAQLVQRFHQHRRRLFNRLTCLLQALRHPRDPAEFIEGRQGLRRLTAPSIQEYSPGYPRSTALPPGS